MRFDLRTVARYIRKAETDELLDRVTVYRDGMEPAALDLMEGELARRGVTPRQITAHEQERREVVLTRPDGSTLRCGFCDRPAITRGRGWYRLFGRVPVIPRIFPRCEIHGPADESA